MKCFFTLITAAALFAACGDASDHSDRDNSDTTTNYQTTPMDTIMTTPMDTSMNRRDTSSYENRPNQPMNPDNK